MVVNLPVPDQPATAVRGAERLSATLDVDDRQAAVPQPASGEMHLARVVGAAVLEPREQTLIFARSLRAEPPGDPTHQAIRAAVFTPYAPATRSPIWKSS